MLILLRHGKRVWNAAHRFAGWVDVVLVDVGREGTRMARRWLREQCFAPTVAYTSLITRTIDTADLILDASGTPRVPVVRTSMLNERHYGRLKGLGWPPLDEHGRGESLAEVRVRLGPYVDGVLLPAMDAGHCVLFVSHGNSIRMLVQLLEGISDDAVGRLEVPTAAPRLHPAAGVLLRAG